MTKPESKKSMKKRPAFSETRIDGGYGWLIVFGSFLVHVLCDGFSYTLGIFMDEFSTEFDIGKGEAGGVSGVLVAVTLCSGPVAAAITNHFGCRVACIVGSIITLIGMILSSIAPNITALYAFCAVITGLGSGLIYLPAIVIVGFYFERFRALAMGLAVCGSGVGTFVFAPLARALINAYGWRGAMLLLAGIVFNSLVCAALFKAVTRSDDSTENRATNSSVQNNDDESVKLLTPPNEPIHSNETSHADESPKGILKNSERTFKISHSVDFLSHEKEKPYPILATNSTANNSTEEISYHPSSRHNRYIKRSVVSKAAKKRDTVFSKPDIFYGSSLFNIPLYRSNPEMFRRGLSDKSNRNEVSDNENVAVEKLWLRMRLTQAAKSISRTVDWHLFKEATFVVFLISNFLTSIGFNGPWIFLEDRAKHDYGISETDAAYLISAIGVGNTFGRVLFGLAGNYYRVDRVFVYSSALVASGIVTALSPLSETYVLLLLYGFGYGFFIGAYVALTSVILVDLLGIERLTNSFGLTLLSMGAATLVGPYFLGKLYDLTGTYSRTFVVMGIFIAISGGIMYPVIAMKSYRQRRQQFLQEMRNNPEKKSESA